MYNTDDNIIEDFDCTFVSRVCKFVRSQNAEMDDLRIISFVRLNPLIKSTKFLCYNSICNVIIHAVPTLTS